ncbi:MAG: hypothetical protein KIT84_31590 [Labilithrix sp.]|nr:hypothetical protein [Labilithrix sp.]MCW5815613.1 hypothetical protein [Labilithrix sp.]
MKTDWCLEGWRGLDETTCYLLPEGDAGDEPAELLIYLAGIVPQTPVRSTSKEHVQRVVGNVARRARVTALLPRGRLGIGPKDAKDWWAWPTTPSDYAKLAAPLTEEWTKERKALERALGYRFKRVYLAGSSSGAYFLSMLAFAGAFEADGYGATSGGSPSAGIAPAAKKAPFYVGWGEADPSVGGAKRLAALLKTAGWPMKASALATGHGAREAYLDEAIAFWRSRM